MNIAFVGSHSTGKTTLVDQFLKDSTLKVVAIKEVARGIIERGFPMGKDAHKDSYINYINDQLKAEQEYKSADYELLISDRTVLDTLCYAIVNRRLPRPTIPSYLIDMMERVWLLEQQLYHLHVFFPIEFELTKDGIRDEDETYRNDVSDEMRAMLAKHSIKYIEVTGTTAERYATLLQHITAAV